MSEKDWENVWRAFEEWHAAEFDPEWDAQMNKIQELVEANL